MESQNGEAGTWLFLGSPSPGLHTFIHSFSRVQEGFLSRKVGKNHSGSCLEAQGYDCPAFWTKPGVTRFELRVDLKHGVGLETSQGSF